jgi:preprotein translocase subunit SecF
MNIKNEIQRIKERNRRVETDKAWETSHTRKIIIAVLTYFVVVLFFISAGFSNPFLNAIVPTVGFLLSTLSLSYFKEIWMKKIKK